MENASKALIIAGAILIAILLISVGIMVMNAVNKPIDEAGEQATSQAAQMFNSKFTTYEGKNKSARNLRSLCQTIIASNSSDSNHQIVFRYLHYDPTDAANPTKKEWMNAKTLINQIEEGKKYEINPLYAYMDNNILKFKTTAITEDDTAFSIANNEGIKNINGNNYLKTEEGYICVFEVHLINN